MVFKIKMITSILVLSFAMVSSLAVILGDSYALSLRFVAMVVFLAATFLMFQRDTHLAFLGPVALPTSILKDNYAPSGANVEVKIPVEGKDGDRVIYWGAKPGNTVIADPMEAYGNFENAGIAVVKNGEAVLKFHCPTKYRVPFGKTLERHVHIRKCCIMTGMLGRVETIQVNC